MAAVQQRVLNWLYSVLTSEYKDVNRTYSDVAQALSHYSSLSPRTDVYTYENGISALLLYVSGTLPVNFRGNTYWFPIGLWVPHNYPREAPMVYVKPTEGMMVRAGQHVDPQGKVYHPYLVRWPEMWDKSTIIDLLAILIDVFAKEPPVIAKQQQIAPPAQQSPAPPPRPPPPPGPNRPPSVVTKTAIEQVTPPAPPPKPSATPQNQPHISPPPPDASRRVSGPPLPPLPPGMNRESARHSWAPPVDRNTYQPQRSSSLRYESPPPLPPQPARQPTLNEPHSPVSPITPPDDQYRHPQPVQQYQQSPQPPRPPYPLQSPQLPQHPQPQQYRQTSYTSPPPNQPGNFQAPGRQGPPRPPGPPAPIPPQQYHPQPPQWQQYPQQPQPQPKPKPEIPDLIDEPLTLDIPAEGSNNLPAPPIPPNPEKDMLLHKLAGALYSQRQHTISQTETSLPGLQAQNQAMRAALAKMHAEINALETLSSMLNNNTTILHTALHDADKVIENSQHRAPPGVDELLVAPTVVGNQLYELVNEERSLGDALFVLGRAVERGRISPAVFTKMTRSLAREWYLKKALAKKIGKGMGLTVY
ncbi:tumor susceptibility protein [Xylogone sp. PMI_703]|nr:tumor susceptibility protein [Xylogone sp. PMI_703]